MGFNGIDKDCGGRAMREWLMKAQTYKDQNIEGWFVSEKLDGFRCFWDGGITRGMLCSTVPWANTTKDARYKTDPVATGLWSNYAKPFYAPDWWLDQLPDFPLDGELWAGRGRFQTVSSTVRSLVPGEDWEAIGYMIFDLPNMVSVLQTGTIRNPHWEKEIKSHFIRFCKGREGKLAPSAFFEEVYSTLCDLNFGSVCTVVPQTVPDDLDALMGALLETGAEGVMIRNPRAWWVPQRSRNILKWKPWHDAEGTVVGYVPGTERLVGRLGALVLAWEGKEFKVGTGFKDHEREASNFPLGSSVTFKYRELTDDGIPKEGRYFRKATVD